MHSTSVGSTSFWVITLGSRSPIRSCYRHAYDCRQPRLRIADRAKRRLPRSSQPLHRLLAPPSVDWGRETRHFSTQGADNVDLDTPTMSRTSCIPQHSSFIIHNRHINLLSSIGVRITQGVLSVRATSVFSDLNGIVTLLRPAMPVALLDSESYGWRAVCQAIRRVFLGSVNSSSEMGVYRRRAEARSDLTIFLSEGRHAIAAKRSMRFHGVSLSSNSDSQSDRFGCRATLCHTSIRRTVRCGPRSFKGGSDRNRRRFQARVFFVLRRSRFEKLTLARRLPYPRQSLVQKRCQMDSSIVSLPDVAGSFDRDPNVRGC